MNRCLHRVRKVWYCFLWKQSSTPVEIWISCFDFIIIKKLLIDTSHTGFILWRNPNLSSSLWCTLHWQPVMVARLNTTSFRLISSDTIPKLRWDHKNHYVIPELILSCVPWYFQLRKLYLVNDEWNLLLTGIFSINFEIPLWMSKYIHTIQCSVMTHPYLDVNLCLTNQILLLGPGWNITF